MKKQQYILISILLFSGILLAGYGDLKKAPESANNLKSKLKWAKSTAKNLEGRYWVGYAFEQLMGENCSIGVHYHYNDQYEGRPSMQEFLSGIRELTTDGGSIADAAKKALDGNKYKKSEPKILKPIAILLQYSNSSMKPEYIRDVRISNLDHYVDLSNKPLLWMGKIEAEASIDYLINIYNDVSYRDSKEDIVTAVALHKQHDKTFSFLTDLIENERSSDIRENAVFWLGQQDDQRALSYLVKVIKKDRSMDVREKAIFSMSQLDLPQATDQLIKIARGRYSKPLREKAVFWLSQKASDKALSTLKDIVVSNEETELQNKAVFALSQMDHQDTVPFLIKVIKTHKNYEVRKKAIFWLGQIDDERALDAIIEIVQK